MKWVLLKNNIIKKRKNKIIWQWALMMMELASLQREIKKDRCRY